MSDLLFSTGSSLKFANAKLIADARGVNLVQVKLDIDEIQSEDHLRILDDKLDKAYALTKRPVIVSDDSWQIPGLNGFPGSYMKSVNEWFSTDDWLRLTKDLTDRRILLIQNLAFSDGQTKKVFSQTINGTLLKEKRGEYMHPHLSITALEGDDGLSVAEVYLKEKNHNLRTGAKNWNDLLDWWINTYKH